VITVTLNKSELKNARNVHEERKRHNLAVGAEEQYDCPPEHSNKYAHQGVIGEVAFAKATGQYWPGYHQGEYDMLDVGDNEVRSTECQSGHLIVHPKDLDPPKESRKTGGRNRRFCLVLLSHKDGIVTAKLAGWCWGRDAEKDAYWRKDTGRPAWFVPQDHLTPAETLISNSKRMEELDRQVEWLRAERHALACRHHLTYSGTEFETPPGEGWVSHAD